MKTMYSKTIVFIFIMFVAATSYLPAQNQSEKTVIAVTKSGTEVKGATTLQAVVFPLQSNSSKFKVCLENQAEGYVKVQILDSRGNQVHYPVFIFDSKGIISYDMSQMPLGNYIVSIKNQRESHQFELKVGQQVTPTIEIKRGIVARVY